MGSVLMVFLGGGLGAVARFGVNSTALRLFGPTLPWGTLTVNVVGSLVMGVVWATVVTQLDALPSQIRLFAATGFLGGFTTFSAFSLDAFLMWERGDGGLALAYVVASVVLSIAALALGYALARAAIV